LKKEAAISRKDSNNNNNQNNNKNNSNNIVTTQQHNNPTTTTTQHLNKTQQQHTTSPTAQQQHQYNNTKLQNSCSRYECAPIDTFVVYSSALIEKSQLNQNVLYGFKGLNTKTEKQSLFEHDLIKSIVTKVNFYLKL